MAKTNGTNSTEPNELESKIIEQVEYYFGDINISKDRFLQSEIRKNDGWVSFQVLTTFNRLKSLSTDFKVINEALKKSDSGLLEFHEDDNKIRRSLLKPIPEFNQDRRDDLKARCVYAKGFPIDTSFDTLKEFFINYGFVEYIQMRRNFQKAFKGSVFVTFNKSEEAEKFIKEEGSKYGDTELIKYFKDNYFKMKNEEKQKRKDEEKKKFKIDLLDKKEVEKKAWLERIVKGAILYMTGFSDGTMREDIREVFDDFAPIAWVDFNKGDEEAWLRFDGEGLASKALTAAKAVNEGKIQIRGAEISCDVLEGDAEIEQWNTIFEKQAEQREKRKKTKPIHNKRPHGKDKYGPKGKKRRFETNSEQANRTMKEKTNTVIKQKPDTEHVVDLQANAEKTVIKHEPGTEHMEVNLQASAVKTKIKEPDTQHVNLQANAEKTVIKQEPGTENIVVKQEPIESN